MLENGKFCSFSKHCEMQFKILKEQLPTEIDLQELTHALYCILYFSSFPDLPSCSSSSTEQGRWSMALWHYQLWCVQGPVAQRLSILASCLLPSNKSQLVRCTEDICLHLWETSLFCIWNFFVCVWNFSVQEISQKQLNSSTPCSQAVSFNSLSLLLLLPHAFPQLQHGSCLWAAVLQDKLAPVCVHYELQLLSGEPAPARVLHELQFLSGLYSSVGSPQDVVCFREISTCCNAKSCVGYRVDICWHGLLHRLQGNNLLHCGLSQEQLGNLYSATWS